MEMSQRRHHHDFVLLHPERPELLGISRDDTLTLPRHTSAEELMTSKLLKALRNLIPLDAVMLRPTKLSPTEPEWGQDRSRLYILKAQTAGPLPEDARWLSLAELSELTYSERGTLETLLREDADPSLVSSSRPAWARRGWLEAAKGWLHEELAGLKRVPIGEPEQLKVWALSSVLRQETDNGDVYLKAVMDHHSAEPRITAKVAELFPELAPKVLATEPAQGWLLLEAFQGEMLDEADPRAQHEVFRRYSSLQLESVAYKDVFLEAGCADRGLDKLKEIIPWLFSESIELHRLTPEERDGLLKREPSILEMLDELAACGIPETLVHGDIHSGNIFAEGDSFTIFDWTDASWSHPFFDIALQYSWDRSAKERGPLVEAYLKPWLQRYDEPAVRRAFTLADALSPLFYAQNHEGIYRGLEPGLGGVFPGVVAHYLKELLKT